MKHVTDSLAALVGGELDPGREAQVREHLQACEQCRREHEQVRTVWEAMSPLAEGPLQARSVWPQVRARTVAADRGPRAWFFGGSLAVQSGLAAAAVLVGVTIGVVLPGTGSGGSGPVQAAAADDVSSWLQSSWLDDSVAGDALADRWLLAGLDETAQAEQEDGS